MQEHRARQSSAGGKQAKGRIGVRMPTDVLPLIISTLGLESAARLWGVNRMLIEFMFLSCMGRIPGVPMLVTPDIVVSATTSGPHNAAAASGAESSISNVRGHPGRAPAGRSAPRTPGGRPSASAEGGPDAAPLAHSIMAAVSGHTPRSKIKQDPDTTRIASAAAHAVAAATALATAVPGGSAAAPSSLPSSHGAGGATDASLAPRIFHGPEFVAAVGGGGRGRAPVSPSHVASQQPGRALSNQPPQDAPSITQIFQGLDWQFRPGCNVSGASHGNSAREQSPTVYNAKRHCSGGGSAHFPSSSGRPLGPTSSGGTGGGAGQHTLPSGERPSGRVCDDAAFGQHSRGRIRSAASAGPPLRAGPASAATSGPLTSTCSAPAAAVAAVAAAAAASAPPKSTVSLHSDAPSLEAIYGDGGPAPSTMSDPAPSNPAPASYQPPQPLATHASGGPRPASEGGDGLDRRISVSSSVAARSPSHAAMARHPYLQNIDTLASAASAAASEAMANPLAPTPPLNTHRVMPEYSAPNPLAAASSCSSGLAAVLAQAAIRGGPAQPACSKTPFAAMPADSRQDFLVPVDGVENQARQALAAQAQADMPGQLGEPENSMEQSLRELMEQPSLPRHNGPAPPLFAPSVQNALAPCGRTHVPQPIQTSVAVSAAAPQRSGDNASVAGRARENVRQFMEPARGGDGKVGAGGVLDNWDPLMHPMLEGNHEGSGEHPDPGIAPHMRLPPPQPVPQQQMPKQRPPCGKASARAPCMQAPQTDESALSAEETRSVPAASGVGASSVCGDGRGDLFARSLEVWCPYLVRTVRQQALQVLQVPGQRVDVRARCSFGGALTVASCCRRGRRSVTAASRASAARTVRQTPRAWPTCLPSCLRTRMPSQTPQGQLSRATAPRRRWLSPPHWEMRLQSYQRSPMALQVVSRFRTFWSAAATMEPRCW